MADKFCIQDMLTKNKAFKDYDPKVIERIADELEPLIQMAEESGMKGSYGTKFVEYLKNRKISIEQMKARKQRASMSVGKTRKRMIEHERGMQAALDMVNVGGRNGEEGELISVAANADSMKRNMESMYLTGLRLIPREVRQGFESGELDRIVMNNIYYELNPIKAKSRGIEPSQHESIRELARTVIKLNNLMKSELERVLGHTIGHADDYLMRRTHNAFKIAGTDKATWINDIKQSLDLAETYGAKAVDSEYINEHLSTMYDKVINYSHQDVTKARTLIYKSPDAEYAYMTKYGYDTMNEAMYASISDVSRSVSLAEVYGWDYHNGFEKLKLEALKQAKAPASAGKGKVRRAAGDADLALRRNDTHFAFVSGQTSQFGSNAWATSGSIVRGAFNIAHLGATGVRSISNSAVLHGYLQSVHDFGFGEIMREQVETTIKQFGKNADVLETLGIASHDQLYGFASELNGTDVLGKAGVLMGAANRKFFGATGLTGMNRYYAAISTSIVARRLGKFAAHTFKELPENIKLTLKRAEIEDEHWGVMQLSIVDLPNGQAMAPNRTLNKKIVSDALNVSEKRAQMLIQEAATKYSNILNEVSQFATTSPGYRVSSYMHGGLSQNHPLRQVLSYALQFKSFDLQMMGNLAFFMKLAAQNPSMRKLTAPVYMSMGMMATWYAGQKLIDFTHGRTTKSDYDPTTLAGITRIGMKSGAAGVLGSLGDALVGWGDENDALRNWAAGPAINFASDALGVVGGIAKGKDVDSKVGALVYNQIPLRSVPGAGALYLPYVEDAMEHITPAYIEHKRMRRLEDEFMAAKKGGW